MTYSSAEITIEMMQLICPVCAIPSEYDPETNKQTTITQNSILFRQSHIWKLDWIAGFFYLDTEIDISIRERLDLNLAVLIQ